MPRTSWLDENANVSNIQERVDELESFTKALADGVVDEAELKTQLDRVTAAIKATEPELNDEQHAKVTTLLVELTAYNIMRTLHEVRAAQARRVFS